MRFIHCSVNARPKAHGEIPKVLHVLHICQVNTVTTQTKKVKQPYLRDTWETKTNLKTINNESLFTECLRNIILIISLQIHRE